MSRTAKVIIAGTLLLFAGAAVIAWAPLKRLEDPLRDLERASRAEAEGASYFVMLGEGRNIDRPFPAMIGGTNVARAAPSLGHEGPGAALLSIGGLDFVHAGSDVRFGLLAGRFVGEGTLLRFYVLHCVGFPLIAATLMAIHFWRVRKDGGISGPL